MEYCATFPRDTASNPFDTGVPSAYRYYADDRREAGIARKHRGSAVTSPKVVLDRFHLSREFDPWFGATNAGDWQRGTIEPPIIFCHWRVRAFHDKGCRSLLTFPALESLGIRGSGRCTRSCISFRVRSSRFTVAFRSHFLRSKNYSRISCGHNLEHFVQPWDE